MEREGLYYGERKICFVLGQLSIICSSYKTDQKPNFISILQSVLQSCSEITDSGET